ncbi:dipeptidyl aminopeptidase/acylaminoacyl peptidase [Pseudogracilibacillus auburnensis]|uniref:Dipeptidyl aminopeptidase/acylaminoacyl peptidase n=1 Tax=Pseudogracilibacillus auburnensis TaxID=1494959 RepID=A0A2V3VPE0_9BACI|nr:alpha/beta fold hydrolase [Pseudogracilibacillus auburnensis]MBO1001391.1 S9 family peptidase [Pseudogracilibacillus auburnensis]PXW83733.1 dipeptidyl aminopeptidase/acylaminoacyl peptidase [Pseudogracilibacillus auburnensis]
MEIFTKPTVEQFFRTYIISDFTVSDDEKRIIFSTNLNGKMNLWALDVPDAFPYLFAQVDQSCNFIKIDKENRYVLAGFDKEGDENYHIYALNRDGGLPEKLITGEPTEKYFFAHLSEDGKRVYYMTSEENPRFLNVRIRDIENDQDKLLHEGETASTYLAAVSDNEATHVYMSILGNTYNKLFIKEDSETYYLVPDPEKTHMNHSPVIIGNESIYFPTNYESEHHYLAKFDLKTKIFSTVKTIENESIQQIKYDKKNNAIYMCTEVGVKDHLYRFSLDTNKLEHIDLPIDVMEKIHIGAEGNLYILGESATIPQNIFQSEDGKEWTQLTNNRVLGVRKEEMVEPDVVTYKSFDGMEIEALLFRANQENDNGYTIFWPHGGPQAAERKFFRAIFQIFLNRGYTIFAPNFRGSTGYGSSFVKLVERDWGHGPRLDCVAGIEWLFGQKITNRNKLFLIGGSFGGYMALLLHGRHPEYFKAVVDMLGVSNLFTFVESIPDHWSTKVERWLGDPVRDKDRFRRDSPITYLDGMTKPMLVIQGAKDPRVVKEESDQIVAKLKEKGRDVQYLVLDDEGHGFSKKENEMKVYQYLLDFLEQYQS